MTQSISLSDRMKQYEAQQQRFLDRSLRAAIRLDGHGFSKFTKAAFSSSVFDDRFYNAIVSTCFDLLRSYPDISYAYTQSDEITLVFPHGAKELNGRTDKLLSLTSAYASVRFNAHLRADGVAPEYLDIAYFDARVWDVPSKEELFNAVLWRARTDCKRNAVDEYARKYFTSKELNNINTREKIEKMRLKGFVYVHEAPTWVQYGTSVKQEQYEHVGINPKTGLERKTMRTRPRAKDLEIGEFSEKLVQMIVQKYW